ncbi:iron-sulfur cluster assembly accessory protein [Bradyrhizobium sp. F1.2.2]|nr:hypothetical protein [Bradyrhizobium sp. CSS354]
MINLTDSAVNALKSVISGSAQPTSGLRIETGGCDGFKYRMSLADEAKPDDTVTERDGVKVFVVDNKSPP